MHDSTVRFMAEKLQEYCRSRICIECPFSYYPTLIGKDGEHKSEFLSCGINIPDEWIIPEVDSHDED